MKKIWVTRIPQRRLAIWSGRPGRRLRSRTSPRIRAISRRSGALRRARTGWPSVAGVGASTGSIESASAGQSDGDLQAQTDRPAVDARGDRQLDGLLLAGSDRADIDAGGGRRGSLPVSVEIDRLVEVDRILELDAGGNGPQRRRRQRAGRGPRSPGGTGNGRHRLGLQLLEEILPQVDGSVLPLLDFGQVDLVHQIDDVVHRRRGGARGGWRRARGAGGRGADGAAGLAAGTGRGGGGAMGLGPCAIARGGASPAASTGVVASGAPVPSSLYFDARLLRTSLVIALRVSSTPIPVVAT